MKSKLNWPFWAFLGLGFLYKGWRGALAMLVVMAELVLIVLLISAIIAFFTSDFRRTLIELGTFTANSGFIKFFCKHGMHTWSEVVEDEPRTNNGALMQKVYRLKYGERKSLCCNQQQVVSRLIEGKRWSRLDEKYYGLRDDCRQ